MPASCRVADIFSTIAPMPVELSERELRDAIAVMGEWDHEGSQAAEAVLEWLGWQGEGPMHLRRYDVQRFVWYELPRKFLTSLDHKREVAEALASTLERVGGRASGYAEVCRSEQTTRLLEAWEAENPGAWKDLRALLERSGIEPPDSDLLTWGDVMGFEESCAHEQVATALEEAVEDGRLVPGTPGFRRRQAEVMNAALQRPRNGSEGPSLLEAIHAERLEHWLRCGHTRSSDVRRAIIGPVAELVAAEPPPIDHDAARVALGPVLWLVEQAEEGIGLTQTGAIIRALVREAAERWPGWWDAELFGPPHREVELALLSELHELLRRQRLLRRSGRRLLTTARARRLQSDPQALLRVLAADLLANDSFGAACAELAAALILDGATVDYGEGLAELVQPAIVTEGWQVDGDPPGVRDVGWAIAGFLRPCEALGILAREAGEPRPSRVTLLPTDAGRGALIAALRARALMPARHP
jgi:hypothetical protein